MSMKKFDLAKSLALKLENQRKSRGAPDRFKQGAAEALDKRERRNRDAAAGLVAFACKLPGDLVKQLHERVAASDESDLNAVVAELLSQALGTGAPSADKPAAKKAPAKAAEKDASDDKAPAKAAPAKKAAAKKSAS